MTARVTASKRPFDEILDHSASVKLPKVAEPDFSNVPEPELIETRISNSRYAWARSAYGPAVRGSTVVGALSYELFSVSCARHRSEQEEGLGIRRIVAVDDNLHHLSFWHECVTLLRSTADRHLFAIRFRRILYRYSEKMFTPIDRELPLALRRYLGAYHFSIFRQWERNDWAQNDDTYRWLRNLARGGRIYVLQADPHAVSTYTTVFKALADASISVDTLSIDDMFAVDGAPNREGKKELKRLVSNEVYVAQWQGQSHYNAEQGFPSEGFYEPLFFDSKLSPRYTDCISTSDLAWRSIQRSAFPEVRVPIGIGPHIKRDANDDWITAFQHPRTGNALEELNAFHQRHSAALPEDLKYSRYIRHHTPYDMIAVSALGDTPWVPQETTRGIVLVIGGGASGLYAALVARSKGYSVKVLEKRTAPSGKKEVLFLSDTTCFYLDHLGVLKLLEGKLTAYSRPSGVGVTIEDYEEALKVRLEEVGGVVYEGSELIATMGGKLVVMNTNTDDDEIVHLDPKDYRQIIVADGASHRIYRILKPNNAKVHRTHKVAFAMLFRSQSVLENRSHSPIAPFAQNHRSDLQIRQFGHAGQTYYAVELDPESFERFRNDSGSPTKEAYKLAKELLIACKLQPRIVPKSLKVFAIQPSYMDPDHITGSFERTPVTYIGDTVVQGHFMLAGVYNAHVRAMNALGMHLAKRTAASRRTFLKVAKKEQNLLWSEAHGRYLDINWVPVTEADSS